MSRFRFRSEHFNFVDKIIEEIAIIQANAALDEHLKGLPRVYGKPNDLFSHCQGTIYRNGVPNTDTHTALLWDLEEIKPKECLHASLKTRHDGKLDCADCGRVLEYRLVEATKENAGE